MINNPHEATSLLVMAVCEQQIFQALSVFSKQEEKEMVIVHQGDSLNSCLDAIQIKKIDVLIIQAPSSARILQDFVHEIQERHLMIDILLFKKTTRSTIYFTTTTRPLDHLSHKTSDFFINALKKQYRCHHIAHQDEKWNECFRHEGWDYSKYEMLLELLRGVTDGEIKPFYQQFDLRRNGYYLFVWELARSEFADYAFNKNIYHFITEMRLEEYKSALRGGSGGEVLIIDLYTVIILFNDFANKSAARRLVEFKKMKNKLAVLGNCQAAYQFISDFVNDVENVHKAYASYQKARPYRFFCREISVLTEESIKLKHKWIPDEFIEETMSDIKKTIRYDIRSERLPMLVRRVFLDIIKPSQSYTLYYILSDAIHSMMKNELTIRDLREALDNPDLLSSIQYSSIEEKCEEMLQFINKLQHQLINKSAIHNTIVLNTIDYINDNYSSEIMIPQIAAAINVSSAHLNHLFKAEVGKGIKRYLTEIRIEKAREILDTTDEPVYFVASSVGFSDFRHFSKTFKTLTGYSPSQYRKRMTQQVIG